MAFTASLMPDILYEVNELFASPNTTQARYGQQPTAAPALLLQQTATSKPRLTDGSCVGATVWFYDAGASNTIYEGSSVDTGLACDNSACGQGQTASIPFDNNIAFHDCKAAQEDRCDNELSFVMESARVIQHLMYQMRLALNKKVINTLFAEAQQNQVPANLMPNYINERGGSNILEIDHANMTEALLFATLVDIRSLNLQNSIPNQILLNGRNFQTSAILAQYNALNDDQRSQKAIFDGLGRDMVWDTHTTHGIDALTGELSTLAVNPNAYIFWNYNFFENQPNMKDGSINLWNFSMEDPDMYYMDGGVRKPVVYDFEHTYACTGYDAAGKRKYLHNYRIFLRGGFKMSPKGFNMAGTSQVYSGVMHYVVNADSGS